MRPGITGLEILDLLDRLYEAGLDDPMLLFYRAHLRPPALRIRVKGYSAKIIINSEYAIGRHDLRDSIFNVLGDRIKHVEHGLLAELRKITPALPYHPFIPGTTRTDEITWLCGHPGCDYAENALVHRRAYPENLK